MRVSYFAVTAVLFAGQPSSASQNPCHSNAKRSSDTCATVSLPTGLCQACGVGAPINVTGHYGDCTRTTEFEDSPVCLDLLHSYVRDNPCDDQRSLALTMYMNASNPDRVEKGRQRLDFFIYSVCENGCDCIPQVQVDPANPSTDLSRGNCQAHAYYDICAIFPNIRLITGADQAAIPNVSELPRVCPRLAEWFTQSGDGDNFLEVPHTSVDPDVAFFLETLVTAEGLLESNEFWGKCMNLEVSQGRINTTSTSTSTSPSSAPSGLYSEVTTMNFQPPSLSPNYNPSTTVSLPIQGRSNATSGTPSPSNSPSLFSSGTPSMFSNSPSTRASTQESVMIPNIRSDEGQALRLSAGELNASFSFTDLNGNSWTHDSFYNGTGDVFIIDKLIKGTIEDPLYVSERFGDDMEYSIPVPSGLYDVRLHFAELSHRRVGKRVFDVMVESTMIKESLDILTLVERRTALVFEELLYCNDGYLNVRFNSIVGHPQICGIEIIPVQPPTPLLITSASPSMSADPTLIPTETFQPSSSTKPSLIASKQPTQSPTSTAFPTLDPTESIQPSMHPTEQKVELRISAGELNSSFAYIDGSGHAWYPDKYYNRTGHPFVRTRHIKGTPNNILYHSHRFGSDLKYTIPIPSGYYSLTLHFAELVHRYVGERVFDVLVEEVVILGSLDILAIVERGTALVVEEILQVTDGQLDVRFRSIVGNPQICGIELVSAEAETSEPSSAPSKESSSSSPSKAPTSMPSVSIMPSPTGSSSPSISPSESVTMSRAPSHEPSVSTWPSVSPSVEKWALRFSAGEVNSSFVYDDTHGNVWTPDVFYNGTGDALIFRRAIGGTHDDVLYTSQRFGPNMRYSIPVPIGHYDVKLHFAETVYENIGDRVFDVILEEEAMVESFDIVELVGRDAAVILEKSLYVTDGYLDLRFRSAIGSPQVCAVEILLIEEVSAPSAGPSSESVAPSDDHSASPTTFRSESPTAFSTAPSTFISTMPSTGPSKNPTEVPSPAASHMPSSMPSAYPSIFVSEQPTIEIVDSIFINAGELDSVYVDNTLAEWALDQYFTPETNTSTSIESTSQPIRRTDKDTMYKTWREGQRIQYEIPIAPGDYIVTLHFSENEYQLAGARLFDVIVEDDVVFYSLDVYDQTGNERRAFTFQSIAHITDNILNIDLLGVAGNAFICGIEVQRNGPHLAHSVPGGPYTVVDVDGSGFRSVFVDGGLSHTHGTGLQLISWDWISSGEVIGSGEHAILNLSVGEHLVSLKVIDDGGNEHDQYTEVVVLPMGYPVLSKISPDSGDVAGNYNVTLSGFFGNYSADEIQVHFGEDVLSGSSKMIVHNQSTLSLAGIPPFPFGVPIQVSVTTPVGGSNQMPFTYVADVPIQFESGTVENMYGPTSLAFGPDGNLYVGTLSGAIVRLALDDNYRVTNSTVSYAIPMSAPEYPFRVILGLAFDPLEFSDYPTVYATHCTLFHGSNASSTGAAINGRVTALSGENLEIVKDVITGLPVSDHDHGAYTLLFNDNGELLLQQGGNTNAGVPGELSGSGVQEDNVLSSATLVANVKDPFFNGTLEYDENGFLKMTSDVKVFASGLRNSFGIMLHSNGYLYATDNGPNPGFGDRSVTCTTSKPDPSEADELNLIEQGNFYGHANRQRGECRWYSVKETSNSVYTSPLGLLASSSNGIVEFESTHFGSQMRGDIIVGQYDAGLYRIVLNEDGRSIRFGPSALLDEGGLNLIQGPDGTLFVAQTTKNKVVFHKPVEADGHELKVKSVFPRRGPSVGQFRLIVSGVNFLSYSNTPLIPNVTVGEQDCTVLSYDNYSLACELTGGPIGTVNVKVDVGGSSSILANGFRFIEGTSFGLSSRMPSIAPSTAPSIAPSIAPSAAPSAVSSVFPTFTKHERSLGSEEPTLRDTPYESHPHWNSYWTQLSTTGNPVKRHEGCFVMVKGKAYLVGGRESERTTMFDPVNLTWTSKSNTPIRLHHLQCVAIDDAIWIVSAWTGDYPYELNVPDIYIYNTTSDTWSTRDGLPEERQRGAAAIVLVENDGVREIYVSHGNRGGHGGHAVALRWLDKYNVDLDVWTVNLPEAPNARDHAGGAYIDGRVCVAGGRDTGRDDFFNSTVLPTDCFDPVTQTWHVGPNIPQGRAGSAFGTTCDGRMMVAGGESFGKAWDNVDVFDGSMWTTAGSMNRGRHGTGLAVDCHCNTVYVASGAGSQGGDDEIRSIEKFFHGLTSC